MKHYGVRILIVAITTVLFMTCVTNPVTGKNQFSLVDETWEIATGKELYPIYTQESFGTYPDRSVSNFISQVGTNVSVVSHRPKFPYEFNLLNTPAVNAFALPGGKISITRGLLYHMESEAQLAAVLAHETAHVNLRHSAIGYSRQILAQAFLLGVMAYTEIEDVKGKEYWQLGSLLGSNLTLLHFSRKQEMESDSLGMEYMVKAGYDPHGMVQIQEILQSLGGTSSKFMNIFETHPLSAERISNARQLLETRYPQRGNVGRESFKKAIADLERTMESYKVLDSAIEAVQQKDVPRALELMKPLKRRAPGHAIFPAIEAYLHQLSRDDTAGLSLAVQSIQIDPHFFYSRYVAGVTATNLSRSRLAIEHLTEADHLIPGRSDIQYLLAQNYERSGDKGHAREYYGKVAQDGSGEFQQLAIQQLGKPSLQ
ncbi:MAG TPA: M48 family metalloprotease [Thermoanaerobaculia bacterium]|nr:M48 family metalloprotease [Thermoanaerobaculia bacterium]HUM29369.1 M48 family metalloprotease [Thermoanaerobaculia bacterium]HXK67615.1 M48 family metalloprotease [Thermoanaerobaculia bacterium]